MHYHRPRGPQPVAVYCTDGIAAFLVEDRRSRLWLTPLQPDGWSQRRRFQPLAPVPLTRYSTAAAAFVLRQVGGPTSALAVYVLPAAVEVA